LWGHSWEIEQAGLWRELDEFLRIVSERVGPAACVDNGALYGGAGA
jgi:hypothetical protein